MSVAVVTHDACLQHDTGPGHPERIDRLRAVLSALKQPEFTGLEWVEAPAAHIASLATVHTSDYIESVLSLHVPHGQYQRIDGDTVASSGSIEAALRAAGAAIEGVDLVMGGRAKAAFVAVRPPGHHAEPDKAMGFCFFNNIAIAAQHARKRWGVNRVAVADFDVHHGNGTQTAFSNDPDMLCVSSHQSPLFPGTGERHERGVANNIVNAPLPIGADSKVFRALWREELLPGIDAFAPEILLISAGFDAHRFDPLAQCLLETEDFTWLTTELVALAEKHSRGRIVSMLEGGYDLIALAECTAEHVRELARGSNVVSPN